MIKKTTTAIKVIVTIALFTSFVATGCNNDKKEEPKETPKTEEPAKQAGDTTNAGDTGKGHPVTPVNKETPPAN